ncbi:threonine synthase [candidate division WOR-3 bacterium]|nr:threonine synthase [candidate division WOR-3 bacterium]
MDKLICRSCNGEFSLSEAIWRCECGGLLDVDFRASFPIDKINRRPSGFWRYREAIPILDDKNIISFNEEFTPMVPLDFNGKEVLIKLDYLFPTGSFKDRGASILISKVKELRIKRVVEDSSGNAGSAIAAYCAKAGIECDIFVPDYTPPGKITQIESYGAKLHRVPGTREDAAHSALRAAKDYYYASHHWNPFFLQGTKTFAFEVAEQLDWISPDSVIVPVGSGSLLLGVYKGFNELLNAGIIDRIPRLIGIQAANCAPVAISFKENSNDVYEIDKKETIAEGISIAAPVRGKQVLESVKNCGGKFITVSEEEIKESLRWICRKGFFIEPTSAATIAGINKYLKESTPDEVIVSIFTGHGLKTTEKILKILNE